MNPLSEHRAETWGINRLNYVMCPPIPHLVEGDLPPLESTLRHGHPREHLEPRSPPGAPWLPSPEDSSERDQKQPCQPGHRKKHGCFPVKQCPPVFQAMCVIMPKNIQSLDVLLCHRSSHPTSRHSADPIPHLCQPIKGRCLTQGPVFRVGRRQGSTLQTD